MGDKPPSNGPPVDPNRLLHPTGIGSGLAAGRRQLEDGTHTRAALRAGRDENTPTIGWLTKMSGGV